MMANVVDMEMKKLSFGLGLESLKNGGPSSARPIFKYLYRVSKIYLFMFSKPFSAWYFIKSISYLDFISRDPE